MTIRQKLVERMNTTEGKERYERVRAQMYQELRDYLKQQLLDLGWVDKGDVLVRYSDPRIGWKQDGTLIIGYHEYKEKVHTIEELNKALCGIRV